MLGCSEKADLSKTYVRDLKRYKLERGAVHSKCSGPACDFMVQMTDRNDTGQLSARDTGTRGVATVVGES